MKTFFRLITFLEGLSYILLLFIAMPLKYWSGNPNFVMMLGMPHGILFILYIFIGVAFFIKYRFYLFNGGISNSRRLIKVILYTFLILVFPLSYFIALGIKTSYQWNRRDMLIVCLASVIPFGTFYIDKKYLR